MDDQQFSKIETALGGLTQQVQGIQQQLVQVDKKLEEHDRRFDKIDHRFEQVDQRFEQVDQRFEQVDRRFEQVDRRFEQVDRRFEQVDQRFEQVDQRFEEVDRRLTENTSDHAEFKQGLEEARKDRDEMWQLIVETFNEFGRKQDETIRFLQVRIEQSDHDRKAFLEGLHGQRERLDGHDARITRLEQSA